MSVLQNFQRIADDLWGRCTFQVENTDDMKRRILVDENEGTLKRSQLTLHYELK
jgi:hypothetical protein